MNWIRTHVHRLFEGVFWQTLFTHFHWVDWVTVAFVVMGLIYGIRKGLMREIVEVLELILITFLVFTYQPAGTTLLRRFFPALSERSLAPAVFIILMLLFWFAVAFVDRYLQKAVHSSVAPFIRGAGGAIIGVFHFLLIWSLISQAIILMPLRTYKIYETGNSSTGPVVKKIAPLIYEIIAEPLKFMPGQKA